MFKSTQEILNHLAEWCEDTGVPMTEVTLLGSAALTIHGIAVPVEYIDIELPQDIIDTLRVSSLQRPVSNTHYLLLETEGFKVKFLSYNLQRKSDQYGALRVATVQQLLEDYVQAGRPKDEEKIQLIKAYLTRA